MTRIDNLRRRAREQRGAAAVEFAIVSVLLFLILFGVVVWGRVFNEIQVLNGAAREGARVASVGGSTTDAQNRVTAVASNSGYPVNGAISVTVKTKAGASVTQEPPCQDSSGTGTDTSQGELTVSWTQNIPINIPLFPSISRNVTITGVFTCE